MQTAAALTMVRDDTFYLKAWLRYYGGMFGRENCYIVNHGRGIEVAQLADGCNIIGIPGDPHPNFDMKRWRMWRRASWHPGMRKVLKSPAYKVMLNTNWWTLSIKPRHCRWTTFS